MRDRVRVAEWDGDGERGERFRFVHRMGEGWPIRAKNGIVVSEHRARG